MPNRIVHGTLVAATVTTVTLDHDYNSVEVMNRSTTSDLYFRVDGTDPVVAGNDSYVVPSGEYLQVDIPGWAKASEIRMISAGTPAFSLTGVI
jgi:hypothetical protein